MDYLVSNGVLKKTKGNYGDQLIVTNKQGGKNKKQRYINDHVYIRFQVLKLLDKLKDILSLEQIKEIHELTIPEQFNKLKEYEKNTSVS